MIVGREAIGALGPWFEMPVELGKIREHAMAAKSTHNDHLRAEPAVMPVMMLRNAQFLWQPEGWSPMDMVQFDTGVATGLQVQQTFEFARRLPVAGDVLRARLRIGDVFERMGRRSGPLTFVEVITDYQSNGEPIAKAVSLWGVTGRLPDPPPDPPRRPAFDDTSQAPPPSTFGPITLTDIVRFQGACGDFTAIHHDSEYARRAGFPRVFSVGMFQGALLATHVTNWLGPANLRRYTTRFVDRVHVGDVLVCSAKAVGATIVGDEHLIDVDMWCTRADESLVLEGSARFAGDASAMSAAALVRHGEAR